MPLYDGMADRPMPCETGKGITIHLDPGYRPKTRKMTAHQKALKCMGKTDSSMLQYVEYAFENIGFIPKWLNIAMY